MSAINRVCKKCGIEKPLTDFYKHPSSPLGHDTKCKACAREAASLNRAIKLHDPDWVERETERCRLKQARHRALGLVKVSPEKKRIYQARYKERYPEKARARNAVGNAVRDGRLQKMPCVICGCAHAQAHHDDYSKPLDVMWLCDTHHKARHVELRRAARLANNPDLNSPDIVLEPCTVESFL